jgi:hypothetical protein
MSTTPVEKPGTMLGPSPLFGSPTLAKLMLELVRLNENRTALNTVGEKM